MRKLWANNLHLLKDLCIIYNETMSTRHLQQKMQVKKNDVSTL